MNKQVLIDAICGRGIGSMDRCIAMTKIGLAEFTGDQWNPAWKWCRAKLAELSEEELERLYREYDLK